MAAEEQPSCCEFMRQQLNYTCEQHPDGCPRQVLMWTGKDVVIVDGGGGFYECNFCPGCGAALPQSTGGEDG